jgi:hypothetical protein
MPQTGTQSIVQYPGLTIVVGGVIEIVVVVVVGGINIGEL